MPMTCSICSNAKRPQIEAALAAGGSLRDIARQFSVSKDALARHKANCIKPAIQLVQAEQQEQGALNVLNRLAHDAALIDEAFGEVWKENSKDVELLLRVLAESRQQNKLALEWQRDSEVATLAERLEQLEQELDALQARKLA